MKPIIPSIIKVVIVCNVLESGGRVGRIFPLGNWNALIDGFYPFEPDDWNPVHRLTTRRGSVKGDLCLGFDGSVRVLLVESGSINLVLSFLVSSRVSSAYNPAATLATAFSESEGFRRDLGRTPFIGLIAKGDVSVFETTGLVVGSSLDSLLTNTKPEPCWAFCFFLIPFPVSPTSLSPIFAICRTRTKKSPLYIRFVQCLCQIDTFLILIL